MAKGAYIGVDGVARKVKQSYVGVSGVARKAKSGYVGVDGLARKFCGGIDPVFANNDWDQIIALCQSGTIPDTWLVGDQKPMTINGMDYAIDIIGKQHDSYFDGSGKAPLTFQLHNVYSEVKGMNNTDTNIAGWGGSVMRNTHLKAILDVMPSEVKSAIKVVSKKTSAGNASSNISTSGDTLFLLSEIEIRGSYPLSVNGEGEQYEYYKNGTSPVKTNISGTKSRWWTRSPVSWDAKQFCFVENNSTGSQNAGGGAYAIGVSFAFCF